MATATQTQTMERIEQAYVARNLGDVRAFLTHRPRIAEILADGITVIPRYFGEGTIMTLIVQDDPDEDRRYIAAYVRTTLAPKAAIDTLYRVKEDWWLDVSEGLREEVLLSLDLVRA
jgi:hypothetical protein